VHEQQQILSATKGSEMQALTGKKHQQKHLCKKANKRILTPWFFAIIATGVLSVI